jgi:uncharacterized damage-inducible protein DinB
MSDAHTTTVTGEHRDLVEALQAHRGFLRHTLAGLTDDQARLTPTVSALSIAAIVKHVAATESSWIDFVLEGPAAMSHTPEEWAAEWQVGPDESPEVLLARYEAVARRTDELVLAGLDLDSSQPLPVAPWFPPDTRRSARRVLVHIVAETAQHAGHADIIRETIDGQRTMG